ncbi:hypothetical protein [Flavobacterium daemonense]|uniref:hypothetical protein n=1 Tax=Flavobacterium daemonense TaxID=1393049 RepID=UPI001185EAA5|nr:hypothetical protein [Flavobacterium daemonense]KAF2334833.1 hypothetical protein FND99_06380 [Flavobacterium daemonense]
MSNIKNSLKLYLAIIIFSLFSCKSDDVRKVYLAQDQEKVTEFPDAKTDPVSYFLKGFVNRTIKGISTDELEYYSRERNDTLLVIVKVRDIFNIERSSRKSLLYSVQDGLHASEHASNKTFYIDIEGNFNTLLVKSPIKYDLDGRFANEELILPFYGKKRPIN